MQQFKKNIIFLFFAAFLSSFLILSCAGGIADKEEFARQIFYTIKDNDYKTFSNFIISKYDILFLVEISSQSEERKKRELERVDIKLKKLNEKMYNAFNKIRVRGRRAGIDWNEAEYQTITSKTKERDNIESGDIYIIFSFKGVNYRIKLDDCIKTNRGWLMSDDPSWKG